MLKSLNIKLSFQQTFSINETTIENFQYLKNQNNEQKNIYNRKKVVFLS